MKKEEVLEKPKERQSNFELLRIVAMFMITIYHAVFYSGVFQIAANTDSKLLAYFIYPFGKVGVSCFMLIMGYFMVNSKFKTEKLLKIIFETFCYSVILFFIWLHRMGFTMDLIEDSDKYFMPIIKVAYWFVSTYVFIYLISPILNCILKNFSIEKIKIFIIIGLVVICVPYCVFGTRWVASDVTYFALIYLIGGYFRLSDFNFKKKSTAILMALVNTFIITAIMIGTLLINKKFNLEIDPLRFGFEYSIFVIMLSIGIFLFFKNLKINNNKIINFIAKSSFAVYLFSDHLVYKKVMWDIDFKMKEYIYKPFYIFGLRVITAVIIIYLFVLVIETLRRELLEKNLFKIKFVQKACSKIDDYINN